MTDIDKKDEEKPSIFSLSPVYELKFVFSIALTITGIVLAAIAFAELKAISNDVYDIINNWKTQPVTDIYVAHYSEDCLDGYQEFNLDNADFEGITKGHCGCTSNSFFYTSSLENCSDSVGNTDYCMTAPKRKSFSARSWRRHRVCYMRGGQAAATWKGGYKHRPYPTENSTCPVGYKLCGSGTYTNGNAVCFPVDTVCPITGLLIAPSETPLSSLSWVKANGNFTVANYSLYYRREHSNELPVIDLRVALTRYSSTDYLDEEYKPGANARGVCYIGRSQEYKKPIAVSNSALAQYSSSEPQQCERVDKRYILYDKIRLDEHYLSNLEHTEYCSSFSLWPHDHENFNASADADYLYSGIKCGTKDGYVCDR